MTADQPRDAAIAALDDLVERWHAWNATDDPDLKVMLGLGLMQDAFDALPNLAALAPAGPTADLRAAFTSGFEAGWETASAQRPHVGSGLGYAAVPVTAVVHDDACCATRGCHPVCSHLCGTDLATPTAVARRRAALDASTTEDAL